MADRDFAQLQAELERNVLNLKQTNDPRLRRDLLMELRRLLIEADRALLEEPE